MAVETEEIGHSLGVEHLKSSLCEPSERKKRNVILPPDVASLTLHTNTFDKHLFCSLNVMKAVFPKP